MPECFNCHNCRYSVYTIDSKTDSMRWFCCKLIDPESGKNPCPEFEHDPTKDLSKLNWSR